MTSNPTYLYTKNELIDQPEYYMFSAYHGKFFLNEYLEQRASYLAVFELKYLTALAEMDSCDGRWLQDWKEVIEMSGEFLSDQVKSSHSRLFSLFGCEINSIANQQFILSLGTDAFIYTEPTLKALLSVAVKQNHMFRDSYYLWLNRFLKKYEVSKKLYSIYHPSMKAASDFYSYLLNYALLSLALLYEYDWTENLKSLNTALKLNDLLCSLSNRDATAEIYLAIILAIHKEIFLVRLLMSEKGVEI